MAFAVRIFTSVILMVSFQCIVGVVVTKRDTTVNREKYLNPKMNEILSMLDDAKLRQVLNKMNPVVNYLNSNANYVYPETNDVNPSANYVYSETNDIDPISNDVNNLETNEIDPITNYVNSETNEVHQVEHDVKPTRNDVKPTTNDGKRETKVVGNGNVDDLGSRSSEEGTFTPSENYQPRHVHIAYGKNSSEVVVTWSTLSLSMLTTVEWGTNMFALSHTSKGDSQLFVDGGSLHRSQWIHRVHLTQLPHDTTFYYHVGGPMGWSAVFGFHTVPEGTTGWPLRLAVYGDMGTVNAHSLVRLQQEAHQGMYDAVLHVGDMAYDMDSNNGSVGDVFMDQIQPIAAYLPYMTCPGNHENKYDFLQYRSRFSMPDYLETESLYYSFDLGPVHFVSISTELYYFGPDQLNRVHRQYQWLVNDLEEASAPAARAARPWIVLFGHRPMYCSTNDQDDCTNIETLTRVGLSKTHWYGLEPVLVKYGVDLAIWAHEHSYERLFPVYNRTVYKGSEDHPYTNPGAPTHITTGSAGCKEHLDPFQLIKPDWSAVRINDYGYTRLTALNASHLHLQQVSDDREGDVVDDFWLIRDTHDNYPHLQL